MSLITDYLEQSEHLAKRDKGRPKQANLRRAVSTAYYALFILLTEAGADKIGTGFSERGKVRLAVRRAFVHADMAAACRSFSSGLNGLPRHLKPLLVHIPDDLVLVAQSFVQLQEARHQADYDFSATLSRSDIIANIDSARSAVAAWNRISKTYEAEVFLLHLLLRRQWER